MADDPFATLGAPGADPFASLGQSSVEPDAVSGPMADPFQNLGKGLPTMEAAQPITLGSILQRPRQAFGALAQRFKNASADAAEHGTGTGIVADLGVDAMLAPDQREARRAYERRSRPMPAGSPTEVATDLAGGLVGSVLSGSPENFAALPAKLVSRIGIAGRPIVSRILQRAVGDAAVNAAIDPAIQAGNIAREQQESYDPFQTLGAAALGATIGGGLGGVHGVGEVRAGSELKTKAAVDDYIRTQATRAADESAPDRLWSALEHRESRGNQAATSPVGARGVAQLMPATAHQVAQDIGRPDLGTLALENSERGAQANRYLGQVYLSQQMKTFGNDEALALAAYNAGPKRVQDWLKRFGNPDEIGRAKWVSMIPLDETRDYVQKILGNAGGQHALAPDEVHARQQHRAELGIPEEPAETPATPEVGQPSKAVQPQEIPHPEIEAADQAQADLQRQSTDLTQQMEHESEFPGDWNREPTEGVVEPTVDTPAAPAINPDLDLTETALNHMRAGTSPKLGEGPSLVSFLIGEGGVRNQGGELSAQDLGIGDKQWKMLVRQNTGLTMAEAAERAQSKGYIGGDLAGGHPVATPDDLMQALLRERGGEKVYSRDRINHEGRLVHDRIADLEDFMRHLDVDPKTHSNAEIRAAMDEYFELERWEAEREGGDPFAEADHANADGQRHADMEGYERARAEGRDMQPMEAGGIFDDVRRGEQDIFGAGGGDESVIKARAAATRIRQMDAIMASTKKGLRQQPRAGAVPAPAGKLAKVKGIPAIARDLLRGLDLVRRQGRLGLKGAAGTYNRLTGMIRTKGAHELDVVAHEIGHAVEFTKQFPALQSVMTNHEAALKALDYEPKKARRHEGFAEWFRWYITNPTFADQVLPGFRQDFEAALAADSPRDLATIKQAQSDYEKFLKAPSLAAAKSMVVEPEKRGLFNAIYRKVQERGPLGAAEDFADEVYRGVVDSLNPWKKAVMKAKRIHERNTGQPLSLNVVDDPYKLLRQMPAVASAGHMDLTKGVHGYNSLDIVGPSFTDALKLALGDKFLKWDPEAIRDFGTYLTGRRAIHLYDRWAAGKMEQPPDALSREFWQQTVSDLELRNPQYVDAARMTHDYTAALWDKRHDAGLVDDKMHALMNVEHPEYVPLFRDVSDRDQIGGRKGSDTEKAGGVIRLKGSDRAYMNPIHSIMQMTYELNTMIARNDALRALDRIGQIIGPDGAQVVERLPATEMKATRVNVNEAVDNAARDIGVDPLDHWMVAQTLEALFGDDALTNVYRAVDMTPRAGENVVWMWDKGQKIPLQLPDGQWGRHMIETLAGATPPMKDLIIDAAAWPARILRTGVTTHPAFFVANWIRDQFTASILTDLGYIPGVDNIRGIGKEFRQGDTARHYNVVGGEVGGMGVAQEQRARGERNVQALRDKGHRIRHFASLDGFAKFTELSETGTRMGLFDRGRKAASKRGLGDWAAAKEGAFDARDLMDFDRHGAWPGVRSLIRVIPFLNAGMQAVDKVARVAGGIRGLPAGFATRFLGGPPASMEEQRALNASLKLWASAAALAVGSLAYRTSMKDDPEFEEVADYVRDTHWVFRLPGTDYFAVVPKPYEIAAVGNIMERAFEATTMHDPTAWGRLADGLGQIFLPAHDAPILVNPMNLAKNRDSFGSPIVPDHLLHTVQPRDQVSGQTSPLAIKLADILRNRTGGKVDLSPAQLDYTVKGVTGSWGRDLLKLGNDGAPMSMSPTDAFVASRFVKDWTRGAVSSKEFWDLASTNDGKFTTAAASFGNLVRDGKFDDATKRLQEMKPAERAYVMTATFARGQDQQYHPLIRAAKAVTEMSGLAKDLQDGNVMVVNADGHLAPLELDPHQRRIAVEGLKKLSVAEQRNALIASGIEGWANSKSPLPSVRYQQEIERAAPGVMQALSMRLGVNTVMPPEEMAAGWSSVRAQLEKQQDPAVLRAMMAAKAGAGSGALERALKTVVPAEAASR